MLNTVNLFIALVVAAITYGTPLLFGTLGEVLTEKSGSLNLGVEGIMFMGGAIGLGGVFYYEKAVWRCSSVCCAPSSPAASPL
jgi:ABC-type uncharacterized transport system permease subunit